MRRYALPLVILLGVTAQAQAPGKDGLAAFTAGVAIDLDRVIPANERGIVCLTTDAAGNVFGGTTGRAAHLFVYDPRQHAARSLLRLDGGIGLAYQLVRLPDGALVIGTQADPTGTAVKTDPAAVGHLIRVRIDNQGKAKMEPLGVPVAGQGIYALAYDAKSDVVVGNTWPDGHFFSCDLKTGKCTDHGAIAGYRTFEKPQHAADLNKGTDENVRYSRQVSRAIAIDPKTGAYTAGKDGALYRFDFEARKLEKLKESLPAADGRAPWASLDAAVVYEDTNEKGKRVTYLVGGTADGHLFELRLFGKDRRLLRPRGRALAQGTIQGLVVREQPVPGFDGVHQVIHGVGGHAEGMPRSFSFTRGGGTSALVAQGIPRVDGQVSMVGFGALTVDGQGTIYAGERDRIGRLVRYPLVPEKRKEAVRLPAAVTVLPPGPIDLTPPKLDCRIVFAPQGTTTDGSGYTAIRVGLDGTVYVGATRYGGYAWLLRFDPAKGGLFMERVVNVRNLVGEVLRGVNTQGKIHGIILVGADGRIWFVTKQAHEEFANRPEYGEDWEGYPGGHLCYYDPATGFSRSMGILKKQEGLMGGAIDDGRQKLYYRTEPKNHFLVYDIKANKVQDRGHVGAACRYMAMDKGGAVYTTGRDNYLCRYDPETGYVEDLLVKVEGAGGYTSPYYIGMGPNGKLYGVGIAHPFVMEFDIANYRKGPFPEVTVRNVAPAAPGGWPVHDIHAGVFGKDGRLYYPLVTTAPLEPGGKAQRHLRLMRFDPKTGKSETVGVPDTSKLDESKVKHAYVRNEKYKLDYIQGMAVGADGSLYMMDIYPQLNVACFPKLTAAK
jgi:hypothetical protein